MVINTKFGIDDAVYTLVKNAFVPDSKWKVFIARVVGIDVSLQHDEQYEHYRVIAFDHLSGVLHDRQLDELFKSEEEAQNVCDKYNKELDTVINTDNVMIVSHNDGITRIQSAKILDCASYGKDTVIGYEDDGEPD